MGILEDRVKNETFIKVPGLTDDIVTVVRCKDCRKNMMCELTLDKPNDWFCADGERKEGR